MSTNCKHNLPLLSKLADLIGICNYAVVQATLPGIQNLGYKFWIIWAVICFSFIPVTYFLYPETANRTLEDIDRFFETKPGIFIHKNRLAMQLHRPDEFIEADARIARGEAGNLGEHKRQSISTERIETKEVV